MNTYPYNNKIIPSLKWFMRFDKYIYYYVKNELNLTINHSLFNIMQ